MWSGGTGGWSSLGLAEEDDGGDGLDGAGFLNDVDDAEPCAAGAGEYVDAEDPHQEVFASRCRLEFLERKRRFGSRKLTDGGVRTDNASPDDVLR